MLVGRATSAERPCQKETSANNTQPSLINSSELERRMQEKAVYSFKTGMRHNSIVVCTSLEDDGLCERKEHPRGLGLVQIRHCF